MSRNLCLLPGCLCCGSRTPHQEQRPPSLGTSQKIYGCSFPPSDWRVALAGLSVMALPVHYLANSSTLAFQSDLPITAQLLKRAVLDPLLPAVPPPFAAGVPGALFQAAGSCQGAPGKLQGHCRQLLPQKLEWRGGWQRAQKSPPINTSCAACIFPHHSDTENTADL